MANEAAPSRRSCKVFETPTSRFCKGFARSHPYSMPMENIICDITAFNYWRIPPIVQLLLAEDMDSPLLFASFGENDVATARQAIADMPLCKALLSPNPATRNLRDSAREIQPLVPILAANLNGPIDLLVGKASKCHESKTVRSRLVSGDLPIGSTIQIGENIQVTSPSFTLLQLARRASLARTIMLATELCGTFAVFKAPQPIRAALQNAARNRRLPAVGGWSPLFDGRGNLTDLWSRPALSTPPELLRLASDVYSKHGRERLRLAASLAKPGAASPFEARTGMLLGLPRKLGGEGYEGYSFNKKISLTEMARSLGGRECCYCDLYWDDGLDVECQSALVHDNAASFLSDSDRTTALKSMGIDVLPITHDQLRSERRCNALSKTVAHLRGIRYRPKTVRQVNAEKALRSELFLDWGGIHQA